MLHHLRSSFQLTRVEHGVICLLFFSFVESERRVLLTALQEKTPKGPVCKIPKKQTTMEQRKDEWEQEQIKVRGGLLALLCLLFFVCSSFLRFWWEIENCPT
jgi:hypothetical protein